VFENTLGFGEDNIYSGMLKNKETNKQTREPYENFS
jgi:hypothetical protein